MHTIQEIEIGTKMNIHQMKKIRITTLSLTIQMRTEPNGNEDLEVVVKKLTRNSLLLLVFQNYDLH